MNKFEVVEGFLMCKKCSAKSPSLSEARIKVAGPGALNVRCGRCGSHEFVNASEVPRAVVPAEMRTLVYPKEEEQPAPELPVPSDNGTEADRVA